MRFYNANGYEFMTLKSDDVSKRFEPLFDERLVGTRHSEDGRLYAILKDDDCTREEPVRRRAGGPELRIWAPFAELVTATRGYSESEADWLL